MAGLTDAELEHFTWFVRKNDREGSPIELGAARRVSSLPWCSPMELAAAQRYEQLYFAAYEGARHANV